MGTIQDIGHLATQYANLQNLQSRWDLYDYCVPPVNIYEKVVEYLHLKKDASVLDVDCGDGEFLLDLRRKHGHRGTLRGIDLSSQLISKARKIQEEERISPKIQFYRGDASSTYTPDDSFDVVVSLFSLYHFSDKEKVLLEWKRILKPGGKIVFATASKENKPEHQRFKKLAEQITGKRAHEQFSLSFNLENGAPRVGKAFRIIDSFVYTGVLYLTSAEPYLKAFDSVRDMFSPAPADNEWLKVKKEVRNQIEGEIAKTGHFTDRVKRGFWVCKKV